MNTDFNQTPVLLPLIQRVIKRIEDVFPLHDKELFNKRAMRFTTKNPFHNQAVPKSVQPPIVAQALLIHRFLPHPVVESSSTGGEKSLNIRQLQLSELRMTNPNASRSVSPVCQSAAGDVNVCSGHLGSRPDEGSFKVVGNGYFGRPDCSTAGEPITPTAT